jgi:hypothetical protein
MVILLPHQKSFFVDLLLRKSEQIFDPQWSPKIPTLVSLSPPFDLVKISPVRRSRLVGFVMRDPSRVVPLMLILKTQDPLASWCPSKSTSLAGRWPMVVNFWRAPSCSLLKALLVGTLGIPPPDPSTTWSRSPTVLAALAILGCWLRSRWRTPLSAYSGTVCVLLPCVGLLLSWAHASVGPIELS